MKKIKKWFLRRGKSEIIQFLKFGLVGLSNTAISLLIYYLFLWIDPKMYLIGNVVGWIVSVFNAFFWNSKYVFSIRSVGIGSYLKKLCKTYVGYGATFLLSTWLLYVEVEILAWSPVICPVLNLLITIPLNFIFNKFWTFR